MASEWSESVRCVGMVGPAAFVGPFFVGAVIYPPLPPPGGALSVAFAGVLSSFNASMRQNVPAALWRTALSQRPLRLGTRGPGVPESDIREQAPAG
ncbi:hypothetical protein GCM10009608_42750 [Pseudonocardia alaniniphila]